ncbi:unnamed protein product [Dracunculus medinensis]|uniref:Uncharacterized protein n=1 Tax=Dracunculus medinensis TaxID=318479 RepID=A0A0N4UKC7_DRAME|nr:unnamed protein product [Dracunculus medinensis]
MQSFDIESLIGERNVSDKTDPMLKSINRNSSKDQQISWNISTNINNDNAHLTDNQRLFKQEFNFDELFNSESTRSVHNRPISINSDVKNFCSSSSSSQG